VQIAILGTPVRVDVYSLDADDGDVVLVNLVGV